MPILSRLLSSIKFHYLKLKYKYWQKHLWRICNRDNYVDLNGLMLGCDLQIKGKDNVIRIEPGTFLRNVKISIIGRGNTLCINNGSSINESARIIIEDCRNSLKIGNGTYINSCFMTLRDNDTILSIGNNCLISANVVIRTSDAHSVIDMNGARINPGSNVRIGDHVWIGYSATILKGV